MSVRLIFSSVRFTWALVNDKFVIVLQVFHLEHSQKPTSGIEIAVQKDYTLFLFSCVRSWLSRIFS